MPGPGDDAGYESAHRRAHERRLDAAVPDLTAGTPVSTANTALLTTVVIMVVVGAFGFARAELLRAIRDYQAAKAGVKAARTTAWAKGRTFVKRAVVVLILLLALVAWNIRDGKHQPRPAPPVPSQGSPRGSPPHR